MRRYLTAVLVGAIAALCISVGLTEAQVGPSFNSRTVNVQASAIQGLVATTNGGTGGSTTATSGRYLKGNGTTWATSTGSASGTGACAANSWASTLNSDAAATCTQPASTNLSDYTSSSFTATATGMTTSPTGAVKYVIVGGNVTLDLPNITGTSNATSFTLTGAPAAVRPVATSKEFVVRVQDNTGSYTFGLGSIGTNGTITLFKDPNGTLFTASGTKAINTISVSYTLQ